MNFDHIKDPIERMYLVRDEQGREKVRNHKKPAMRFRASGLAACKRQEYYRQSGYLPAPRYGTSDDYSVDGDAHHDIVRQMMLAYGVKLAGITQAEDGSTHEDMFVTQDFDVEGRTITISTRQDGWIFNGDYGWMLMEIKSVGHWVYHYMQKAYEAGWTDEVVHSLPFSRLLQLRSTIIKVRHDDVQEDKVWLEDGDSRKCFYAVFGHLHHNGDVAFFQQSGEQIPDDLFIVNDQYPVWFALGVFHALPSDEKKRHNRHHLREMIRLCLRLAGPNLHDKASRPASASLVNPIYRLSPAGL